LGYTIAWYQRGETIDYQNEKLEIQQEENSLAVRTRDEYKNQVELWREKHRLDLQAVQQKASELVSERDRLQRQKLELESTLTEARSETREKRSQQQQEENEIGTLRYRNRQLEFQVKEMEELNAKLKVEVENLILAQKLKGGVSDHPFVRPVEQEDKDDLTKIKGIGPFIEKRLNMIGIYTFQQLAALSPEMVDRVGAAIEFFPHRIIRDNWVGQARAFSGAG
jgi:predicted flap endonuclease-1-like 5' DNA nuclease